MNIKFKIFSLLLIIFMVSCETTDLDLLDNPNGVGTSEGKVELLLNATQTSLLSILSGTMNNYGMRYTRMQHQDGNYVGSPEYYDTPWRYYYADLKADNKILIPLALEKGYFKHAGVAQVLEAYATVAMVDFWGDIVYSEAGVSGIINPARDDDAAVYEAMYLLLDEAITNLSTDSLYDLDVDIYFNGDVSKWIKLANTLKLKMYVQTRLYNETASTTGINAILADGNYITSSADDFQFTYGTAIANPDTRHPKYVENYNASGAGQYMSNAYMYELKENNDPRLRYYFFRQTGSDPVGANLVCDPESEDDNILCYIGDGYWGRDHALIAGIPGDTSLRTTWGLYPAGGEFDKGTPSTADAGDGAGGAGIHPIMLSSFVNFLKAEATLTMSGVSGDPAALLETAITESITKVMSFGSLPNVDLGTMEPTATEVTDFIAGVMADFNSADDEGKLEIIMTQYWVALHGNGIEEYNNYRRTGYPIMQHPVTEGTVFPRVNPYPANHVNNNSNAGQQQITNQVFWDTNPANGFID